MLRLPEHVPARPLAVFRMVIGLVGAVKALELGASPLLGTRPVPLYAFVPALPSAVWPVLAVVMFVAAGLVVVGFRARIGALVVGSSALAFVWGAGYYSNHVYLLATLAVMLSFTDCDSALSLRSRFGRGTDRVWAPPVHLLKAQISVVYVFAAISKLNVDFLSGNGLASWGFHSMLVPRSVMVLPVLVAMAFGAVATELFVATCLWAPGLRPVAFVLGVLLHLGMIVFLSDGLPAIVELGLFAAMMVGGYLLFFDRVPDVVRGRLPGRVGREAAAAGATGPAVPRR